MILFRVEEDEPDQIITTNNHHLHNGSPNDDDINGGLSYPPDDIHQSTADMKPHSSTRKLSIEINFDISMEKKRINHSSSSPPSDNWLNSIRRSRI